MKLLVGFYALVAACLLTGCNAASTASAPGGSASDTKLAGKLVLTGSSTLAPMIAEMGKRFEEQHGQVRIDVQTGGTSRGIADALSGTAHIGMASRVLKPEETEQGLMTHRIAVDGICLIVHESNPVHSLTDAQVVAIYTGQLDQWQPVGGSDSSIVVVNKAEGRATLEVFLEYFQLENSQIMAHVVGGDNQQVIQTVAGNPAAIGYVSIGEATSEVEAETPIRLLAAGNVAPTGANVADGSYPVTRPLSLVTHGEPGDLARAFIKFAQSKAVHDLVEQQGFVAIGG